MALFFDQAWFDAQLAQMGASRADVARLLALTPLQVDELWKDQRELSARDVALLGRFLNHPARVIAERAGVSTPVPEEHPSAETTIIELQERVERLEGQVRFLLAEIDRIRSSEPRG
jgi:hypothetical protein